VCFEIGEFQRADPADDDDEAVSTEMLAMAETAVRQLIVDKFLLMVTRWHLLGVSGDHINVVEGARLPERLYASPISAIKQSDDYRTAD
jgi:hypothetical protein